MADPMYDKGLWDEAILSHLDGPDCQVGEELGLTILDDTGGPAAYTWLGTLVASQVGRQGELWTFTRAGRVWAGPMTHEPTRQVRFRRVS